jgi:hypothetical protein
MDNEQFNLLLGRIDAQTVTLNDLQVEVKGVSTKMDFIVGPDGNNGVISEFKDRLKTVEGRQVYFSGVSAATGVGLGLVLRWVASKMFGVHFDG